MNTIDVNEGIIKLGKQGEHLVSKVRFPIAATINKYGNGTFILLVRRPGDVNMYPARTYQDDDYLYWDVTGVDTTYAGEGRCELQYLVNNTLVKSIVYITQIEESIWPLHPNDPRFVPPMPYYPDEDHRPRPYPPMPPGPPHRKTWRHDHYREWDYLPPHHMPPHPPVQHRYAPPGTNPFNQDIMDPGKSWYHDMLIQSIMAMKAAQDCNDEVNNVKESEEAAKNSAQTAQYAATAAAEAELAAKMAKVDITSEKQQIESMIANIPRFIPTFNGEYSATETYKMNDIVSADNKMYWHVSAAQTTGVDVSDTDVWKAFFVNS